MSLKVATEMLCLSQKISVNLDNNVGHRSLVSFLGTHCYCSLLYEQSQCSNSCRLIVPPSDFCDALIFKNSFLEKVGPSTETQGLWVDLKSYQASSKRSQSFWLLIGARKSLYFSAQSEWSMLKSPFVFFNTDMRKEAHLLAMFVWAVRQRFFGVKSSSISA